MAIFMPQFVIPDMRSGLGLGVVDATQDLTVSWKITGQSALLSYAITIMSNTSASTQLYTTGQISVGCPAYGTTSDGEPQFFSYTIPAAALSSAGITNGSEYKIIIRQWWSANDSVTQSSASVFATRAAPTLSIAAIGVSSVIYSRYYTFTGNYSQAQGDVLNWFRWRIAYAGQTDRPFVDTGNISGTMDISCYYDGFFTGSSYAIRLTCQTESGVEADTGWVNFSCDYQVSQTTGEVTAGCVGGTDAIVVDWTSMEADLDPDVQGFALYRMQAATSELVKIAETDNTVFKLYDYSAASQQGPYFYYLFPVGATTYVSEPLVSGGVMPCWWNWSLLVCDATDDDSIFTVNAAYRFRYNVQSGTVSNNNMPNLLQNFTPYPKIQLAPQNFRSGTISALLGAIDWTSGQPQYIDKIEWEKALNALSVSQKPMFLKNRKGDIIRVKLSQPVTMTTADATQEQTQTASLSWVEIGSADGVGLYATQYVGVQSPEGAYKPQYVMDVSDATADAAQMRIDKTGYGPNGKITGEAFVRVEGTTIIMPSEMEGV